MEDRSDALPVCVVIPSYNRASLLPRTLASVWSQTRLPAEVIVVDDCSADGTEDVARELGAAVVRHEQNRGEGAARNSGIQATRQPWIALLDSDDEWLPEHLERLFAHRDGHVLVGDAGLALGSMPMRLFGWVGARPRLLRSPRDVVYPVNCVTPSGVLLRREVVLRAGGFAPDMPRCSDLDTWIRVLELGSGLAISSPGFVYHVHDEQASSDARAMFISHRAVVTSYRKRAWYRESLLRRYEGIGAWDAFRRATRERGPRTALTEFARSLLERPERALGVARILSWRWRGRRRLQRLGGGHRRAASAPANSLGAKRRSSP